MNGNFKYIGILMFFLMISCTNFPHEAVAVQVAGLNALYRSGQTFIVWDGVENFGDLAPEDQVQGGILQKAFKKKHDVFKKAEKNGNTIRYRIYRSDRPINSGSIKDAELIGETEPLSAYYPYHLGMSWYDDNKSKLTVPRVGINPESPLDDGQELFVHTVKKRGKSFYAVLAVINGKENRFVGEGNSLKKPIDEQTAVSEPVLQWKREIGKKEHYIYQFGPAEIRYYMQWVEEPYASAPSRFEWAVAVPGSYTKDEPTSLQLALHGWGGSVDQGTYWYNVRPSTIRIATVDYPPQDWWYGYKEANGSSKSLSNDKVFNYTEKRLLLFIEWVKKNWRIDDNLIFVEGASMGGSGAMSLGMKNGDLFCYADSWVGISSWRNNGHFRTGEQKRWGTVNELMNYNGVRFDDWMDLAWWVRNFPQKETPFLSFANGKNDGQIGWNQAVLTVKALQETKRPFVFLWGMQGHGQRSKFMMDPSTMALNKSVPAFRNCSLDGNIGTVKKLDVPQKFQFAKRPVLDDWYDGDSEGQINAFLGWDDVSEKEALYEISVFLIKDAPKDTCTVDMTPRRTQRFKAKPGERFRWENVDGGRVIQSGEVVADGIGLVTIEKLIISKGKSRIKIFPISSARSF